MDKIIRICKGYLISLAAFGLLTLVGALLLKFTPFPESGSYYYLMGTMALCCLFVGSYMAAFFQRAGLLVGIFFSAVLLLLILLMVSTAFGGFLSVSMLSPALLIPVGAGAIGGILGANVKK